MAHNKSWDSLTQKEKEEILRSEGKPWNYQPQGWEKDQFAKKINNDAQRNTTSGDHRYKGGGPGSIPL